MKTLFELGVEFYDGDRGNNYPSASDFFEKEHCLFLDAKNIDVNHFNFENTHFITKEKDNILRGGKLKRGDIVITTRGTVGNLAYYDKDIPFEHIRINSGMLIIRCTDKSSIHSKILFYHLQSDYVRKQINMITSGSVQKQLTIPVLSRIKINNSADDIDVLEFIDKKVELNKRINDNLSNSGLTI